MPSGRVFPWLGAGSLHQMDHRPAYPGPLTRHPARFGCADPPSLRTDDADRILARAEAARALLREVEAWLRRTPPRLTTRALPAQPLGRSG
ncbi:hypothetical protein AURDEDRAFT_183511 [Auricularia subglabra TFB-10046 SS5]|nr:hypothetical protein AURDEDRAFT_183511 [Auricularia subglabra TFB-10046 SS5]